MDGLLMIDDAIKGFMEVKATLRDDDDVVKTQEVQRWPISFIPRGQR